MHERSAYPSPETNQTPLDASRITVITHLETIQINQWSGSYTAKKSSGFSNRHAWFVGGEMYLTKAKAWEDAYYKSPRHEYVMAFTGCHFHGCQTCFDLSTMNTHLNKYMGELFREIMR